MKVIKELEAHIEAINSGKLTVGGETVHPGKEIEFPVAASFGDCIPQGDLYITLVPEDYEEKGVSYIQLPPEHSFNKTGVMQLVPGNTEGSRHVLQVNDPSSVKIKIPTEWDETDLIGPILHFTHGGKITHPKHGDVIIPDAGTYNITYQRNWEQEQQRARRAID